jgi:very-short-patch-repair endonuclease
MDNEIENMRLENMSEMYSSPALGLGNNEVTGGGYGGDSPMMPPDMGMGGAMMPPAPNMNIGGIGGEGGGGGEIPPDIGLLLGGGEGGGGGMTPSANILYENYKTVFSDSKKIISGDNKKYASENNITYNNQELGFSINGILPEEPDFEALSDISSRWGMPGCYASLLQSPENNNLINRITDKYIKEAKLISNQKNKNLPNVGFANATKLENQLHQAILRSNVPSSYFMQYAINGDKRFIVDGAFPSLKIAVEADGETWHVDQEKIQRDRYRDTQLASQGWIVLRFTEDELNDKIQDVIALIQKAINIRNQSQNQNKTIAKIEGEMNKLAETINGE